MSTKDKAPEVKSGAKVNPHEEASTSIVREPSFWVSVNPPLDVNPTEATLWRMWIRLGDTVVESNDHLATSRGWHSLPELDQQLERLGWKRTSPWELGSSCGYVARIRLLVDRVLEEIQS